MTSDEAIAHNLRAADELLGWITEEEQRMNDERILSRLGEFREENKMNLKVIEEKWKREFGEEANSPGNHFQLQKEEGNLRDAYFQMLEAKTDQRDLSSRQDPYSTLPYDSTEASARSATDSLAGSFISDSYFPMEYGWDEYMLRSARSILFGSNKEVDLDRDQSTEESISAFGSRWDPGITIPQPFSMTIRDEIAPLENTYSKEFVKELVLSKLQDDLKEDNLENREFKARPIPRSTYEPKYDDMLRKADERRMYFKEYSEEITRDKIQPFNLTPSSGGNHARRCRSMDNIADQPQPIRFRARPAPDFAMITRRTNSEEEEKRKQLRKERAKELLALSALPANMQRYARGDVQRILKEKRHKSRCYEQLKFTPDTLKGFVPNFRNLHQQAERNLNAAKLKNTTTIPEPFKLTQQFPCRFETHKEEVRKRHTAMRRTRSIGNLQPVETKTNVAAELRQLATKRQIERWDKKYEPRRYEQDEREEELKERVRQRLKEHDLAVRKKIEERRQELLEMTEERKRNAMNNQKEMKERVWQKKSVLDRQADLVRKQSANFRYREALKSAQGDKRIFRPSGVAPPVFPIPQPPPRLQNTMRRSASAVQGLDDNYTSPKDSAHSRSGSNKSSHNSNRSSQKTFSKEEDEEEYLHLEIEGLAMDVLKKEASGEGQSPKEPEYTSPSSNSSSTLSSASKSSNSSSQKSRASSRPRSGASRKSKE